MFVKICGVTTEEDALLAVAMDADAVGFVFAPSSRRVRPDDVRDIAKRLPHEVLTVGVFRNERPEQVVQTVNRAGLKAAQLHGGEPDAEIDYVAQRVPVVVQALPAGDERMRTAGRSGAEIVLVDSEDPGSGTAFDWSLVEGVSARMKMLLAGGLTPDNVATAIERVRPWGVDVSTGVEEAPGKKDATRVRRFIEEARRAGEKLRAESGWEPVSEPPYDWQIDGEVTR